MSTPSSTPAPATSVLLAAATPALPPYTEEEERWIRPRDSLDPVQHRPLDINSAFYPSNTSVHILPAFDEAFNAGLMTGTGVSTNFTFVDLQEYGILPHSRTYYCLLFSLYHMFIVFVISY